jgi:hypothetical protein
MYIRDATLRLAGALSRASRSQTAPTVSSSVLCFVQATLTLRLNTPRIATVLTLSTRLLYLPKMVDATWFAPLTSSNTVVGPTD